MRFALAAILLLSASALAGCSSTTTTSTGPATTTSGPTRTTVLIHTSVGDMLAQLDDDKAPVTVANFLTYVREGFYKDLHCYRIEPNFVNQCGGERDGKTGTHAAIKNEAVSSGLHNTKYTLAMARLGAECQGCPDKPDSATTEFYINAVDNCFLDPRATSSCPDKAATDAGYAVFGTLISGKEVSDRMNTMAGQASPTFSVTLAAAGATTSSYAAPPPPPPPPPCPAGPRMPHVAGGGSVDLDLITPGFWNVCGDKDVVYAWAHNNGTQPIDFTWSVVGAGGGKLPEGWGITFQSPGGTLKPAGTKVNVNGQTTYPDWAATIITLKIPPTQTATDVPVELRAADGVHPFIIHVAYPRGTVSGAGSQVTVHYVGTFADDGSQFDAGDLPPMVLGSGRTVPGFDNGLMGLAQGENATLSIPPAFAYGYDNPPAQPGQPDFQRFNGRTLVFDITMKKVA